MLFLHFIGLTMGLGTSFAHAFLAIATSKMQEDEARRFQLQSLVLSRMGHVGIVLLVISGLYLITPYWQVLTSLPLLIAKLMLVLALIVLIILIEVRSKRAKNGDAVAQLKKMESLGKMTLLIGLAIVILAVTVFH
ncbi:hypothetical protein GCM10028805_28770 [Spirosoma harenae]